MSVLDYLDVSFNQIRIVSHDAFKGSFNLRVVRLCGNYLTDPPDFSYLPKIQYLDFSENAITAVSEIDLRNYTFLSSLNLAQNYITHVSFPRNLSITRGKTWEIIY